MGPSLVVVLKPDSQDALKVPTIEDQKPIETLAPGGANLAVGHTNSSETSFGTASGSVPSAYSGRCIPIRWKAMS
jgi:hypothetical protein